MSLLQSLISYWQLEEASGTRVDVHGSNDLTDNNTVTTAAGIILNSAHFTRANTEYLSHADNASLSIGLGNPFSFSTWFYIDSFPGEMGVVSKRTTAGGMDHYFEIINATKARWSVHNGTGQTFVDGGSYSASTWYHAVMWYDPADQKAHFRINDTTTYSTATTTTGARDGSDDFRIGSFNGTTYPFDGRIDETGFWKKVLSAAEITQLYNGGAGLPYSDFLPGARGLSAIEGGVIAKAGGGASGLHPIDKGFIA